jgi:HEAT repeat protein
MVTREEIAKLIGQLHGPEAEAASAECTLTGMSETLPMVVAAYEGEPNVGRRATLIHCLREYRDNTVVPTLHRALLEADERVWKEALDGLVALGSEEAELALREARDRLAGQLSGGVKRAWIDEAIEQIGENKRPG